MEKTIKSTTISKKRKLKSKAKKTASKPKNIKLDPEVTELTTKDVGIENISKPKDMLNSPLTEEICEKYPILKNQELITKFLEVSMTNNQKGRIRQTIRDNLKGTDNILLPDVIHNRIQAILKSTTNLTDTDLRKIRILYNMLSTTLRSEPKDDKKPKAVNLKKSEGGGDVKEEKAQKEEKAEKEDGKKEKKEKKQQLAQKVRGPKRYVVFLGNLPLDVDKEKIMNHFVELNEHVKDIRIPKPADGKKSAIAYVELSNEPSYELALSKHHSMLNNRRINVLYTAQQNGKISKTEAKGKAAKLVALQKSGKLIGSIPLNKKRSHRRMILKQARAREAAAIA